MIALREEPRQRPADGAAKPNPIDVTNSVRDGTAPAKDTKMVVDRVTFGTLRR